MIVLPIELAQLEKNFVAAGAGAQALAQELLRFGHFAHVAEPVSRDRVGFDPLRVELSRKPQPGQNLALVAAREMSVFGDQKMPAKALDPISGWPEKAHFSLMLLFRLAALLGSHVAAVPGRLRLIKDRGVIAAVKIDIGLHEEVVRKHAAAIPQ